MPIQCDSIKRSCPKCASESMFDVDGEKYFCPKCLYEEKIQGEKIEQKEEAGNQEMVKID